MASGFGLGLLGFGGSSCIFQTGPGGVRLDGQEPAVCWGRPHALTAAILELQEGLGVL